MACFSSFRVVSCDVGKSGSWEVGKFLPLLVCPRCVIDTGHGMDTARTLRQGARGGETGRTAGCGMQPPRGSICPPGRAHVVLTYFWLLIFGLPHAITVNARTKTPPLYPSPFSLLPSLSPLPSFPVISCLISCLSPALDLSSLLPAHSNMTKGEGDK